MLPVWLRRAGYVTAHVGKFLNRYHQRDRRAAVAPGWDQWYTELDSSQDTYYDWDLSRNGRRIHYGSAPRDYAPRVFERSAVAARSQVRATPQTASSLRSTRSLLTRASTGTARTRCGAVPDPRDIGKFGDVSLPQPPSFNEADVSDKPSFLAHQRRLTERRSTSPTARYRCGLASLQEVDRTVGRLYGEFRDLGELSRTVFIFYTDNGVFFGEHRIGGGKLYPYEEADRTPLYIRLPTALPGPPGCPGQRSRSQTSTSHPRCWPWPMPDRVARRGAAG